MGTMNFSRSGWLFEFVAHLFFHFWPLDTINSVTWLAFESVASLMVCFFRPPNSFFFVIYL